MAFTFLKEINNAEIGGSLYDEEGAKLVKQIMEGAKNKNVEILLPTDYVISSKFGEDGEIRESDLDKGIPEGFMGLDVGAASSEKFAKAIQESKTLIWNGPMGVFEMDSFAKGTS
jgi:phosphoglycerate kinase